MIVRWKLEMAGSKDTVTGSIEIEDDEDGVSDDYIEEMVFEDARQHIQVIWKKEADDGDS